MAGAAQSKGCAVICMVDLVGGSAVGGSAVGGGGRRLSLVLDG